MTFSESVQIHDEYKEGNRGKCALHHGKSYSSLSLYQDNNTEPKLDLCQKVKI